jgi:hypothetical protein
MGRNTRYRERIRSETVSVESKGLLGMLRAELRADFGLSRIEAEVLAIRCKRWLGDMTAALLPGQTALTVPATTCMRLVRRQRLRVVVTVVDVSADGATWRESGLETVQRSRAVRVLHEVWRQGGWTNLAELGALLNLTPNALSARLAPLRSAGLWLPHLRNESCPEGAEPLEPWVVRRLLDGGSAEAVRRLLGWSIAAIEALIRDTVSAFAAHREGISEAALATRLGRHPSEVQALLQVVARRSRSDGWRQWQRSYGDHQGSAAGHNATEEHILATLRQDHGMSPALARLLFGRLREHAMRVQTSHLASDGQQLLFFAISTDEGARAKLHEAKVVPVCLSYFTEQDLNDGPRGTHRFRVRRLKFARILRYATEARAQGALLTLPDLAMLMGIHINAVKHAIAENRNVVVPTRGLVKDIGRGQTHRREIVELYLQMHTETEIVDRTGHSYCSVEAYLKEFARVVALADRGLNDVMIRRITGRSMALVQIYLGLYRKYDQPQYAFRLAHIRRVFARDDSAEASGNPKKKAYSPTVWSEP